MLTVAAILSLSIAAVAVGRVRYLREEQEHWQAIASSLEVRYERHGGGWLLRGPLAPDDPLEVVIDQELTHHGRGIQRFTRLRVDASARLPRHLTLGDEHYWFGTLERRGTPNQRTGDRRFDACFGLRGGEVHVSALFSEETRALLMRVAERFHVHLEAGQLVLQLRGSRPRLRDLERGLALMRRVASALSLERLREQLAHNANHDSSPRVRLRSLRLLTAHFPDSDEAREACRYALHELDPEHRLTAAIALGAEGLAVATALACAVTVAVSERERAARHLLQHAPEDTTLEVCEALLTSPSARLQATAIELRHALGVPIDDTTLRRLILADGADIERLCNALGQAEDRRAEPLLLDLLPGAPYALRRAIARGLGDVGTRHAIPTLVALGEERDDSVLQHIARGSRARIRARLDPSRAGGLSLTQPTDAGEGALSLADDHRGALSPPDPDTESSS